MAVVQAWYDSRRTLGAPAAASYWAAFLDTRATLNAEARKAELAARSPEWLLKRLEQVRGQIIQLDKWKGSMELEALTARGDVAAGLSRAIGSVISAQLNAQGRVAAAQVEAQGRISEKELEISERARRALELSHETLGRLESIQENITESGLDAAEAVSVYIATLNTIAKENSGNPDAIANAYFQAWTQAVTLGHAAAAEWIAKRLGNDPVGYMRDRYGVVPEETMEALREKIDQYGGVSGGMNLLLDGLSIMLGVDPSTQGAASSSPAGFLSGLLTPPDYTEADARRQQLLAEEQRVLAQLDAEMSRAPGGLSSRYTPNLLLAPVAFAPHKNQRVIDSVAAAHAADPLQVEAGFDAARLARSPRRAANAAFRGGLAEAIPTGPVANTALNFDAGETVYAWLADEATAVLTALTSAKTPQEKASAIVQYEELARVADRLPFLNEDAIGTFFNDIKGGLTYFDKQDNEVIGYQYLIAVMNDTKNAANVLIGSGEDIHFGEIFSTQIDRVLQMKNPTERVMAAAALAQQTLDLPVDLIGSTADVLVDALARAQAGGDLALLESELYNIKNTASEYGADEYLRYAEIYRKSEPIDANATIGIPGAPDPIAAGTTPAQRDALPSRAPPKKDIYAAPGGVQVVERSKASGEILDLPDPAEVLNVENLPPTAPRPELPLVAGTPYMIPTNSLSDQQLDQIVASLQRTPELGAQLDDPTAIRLAAAARKKSPEEMRAALRAAPSLPFDLIPAFQWTDEDLMIDAASEAP